MIEQIEKLAEKAEEAEENANGDDVEQESTWQNAST